MKVTRWMLTVGVVLAMSLHGTAAHAQFGEPDFVQFKTEAGAGVVVQGDRAAPLWLDEADFPGVVRAAKDLQADIQRVTNVSPELLTQPKAHAESAIIIGTIGKSRRIDDLVASGKLDVSKVRGKWESFVVQVIDHPAADVNRAIVIAGSDKRGTIYGVYELSAQMGVSPWYWWADVPTTHRDAVFVKRGRYVVDEPVVK